MRKRFTFLLLVTIVGGLSSCGTFADKSAAEKVAAGMFESVKSGDLDAAMSFYSPLFFEKTAETKWKSFFSGVHDNLGDLKAYKLGTWQMSTRVGTKAGKYFIAQYTVSYSNGTTNQTLTIFKSDEGQWKIVAHHTELKVEVEKI